MRNYLETVTNIQNYLKTSSHNVVAKSDSRKSSTVFLLESLLGDKRFVVKIRVDSDVEFVTVETYSMITIPEPYRVAAAQRITSLNSNFKIGYLGMTESGNIYSHTESSFDDIAINEDTYEQLEIISISMVNRHYDDFLQIARGVLFVDKDAEDERRRIAKSHKIDDDDNDDNDDDNDENDKVGDDIDDEIIRSLFERIFDNLPDDLDDDDDIDVESKEITDTANNEDTSDSSDNAS